MNNQLKSLFIPIWMLGLTWVIGQSIWALWQGKSALIWGGLFLSACVGILFIMSLFFRKQARTSRNLWFWSGLIFMGTLLSLWGLSAHQTYSDFISVIAALNFCLITWNVYVYWYSRLSPQNHFSLTLGQSLPELNFLDLEGKQVNLDQWKGKPALIMFYRGNWCPLCMTQIREVAAHYRELAASRVELFLISPQSMQHTWELAQKFEVPFHFLQDPEGKMAQKLGIYHEHGLPTGMQVLGYESDTVLPTVIIIDEESIICYIEIADNYRLRPDPQVFKEIIANLNTQNFRTTN